MDVLDYQYTIHALARTIRRKVATIIPEHERDDVEVFDIAEMLMGQGYDDISQVPDIETVIRTHHYGH